MGNEQSTPAPRRPTNKLSKPKTNSSTNTPTTKTSQPPSRRNSLLGNVGRLSNKQSTLSVDAIDGEERQQKQRKRMSMFRSKTSQPAQLEIKSGVEIDHIDQSPVKRLSLNNSAINLERERHHSAPVESRPPFRTARISLQHVPYSQHRQQLSLVPEAPPPARQKELVAHNEVGPPNPELTSRNNSDTELYGPIRRRSLLQHGVATRNSWVANDSRQSLPSQSHSHIDLEDYYYNPAKPTSSPLSDLANLNSAFGENIPGPRVATPDDLGHIGAFKLGSLRITNGAASPSPSIEGKHGSARDDDYTSAGEARGIAQSRHNPLPRSLTIGVPPELIKAPWMARSESPLRQEYAGYDAREPLTIDTHLPLPEFALFKFSDADSPTKSLDLARAYQHDIALSPFSFEYSPPVSPKLEATSKHMAVDDDLFEPEPGTPDISHEPRSFDSGYQGGVEKKNSKGPRELAPKLLAKADSGYSSNVSLRSFKSNPPVPAKEAPPTTPRAPISRTASSTYSVASATSTTSDATLRTKKSLPALPLENAVPAQPYRQAPAVPPKHSSVKNSSLAPTLPNKSADQNRAAAQARPNVIVKLQHSHTRSQSIPSVPSVARLAREDLRPNHSPTASEISTTSSSSSSTSKWRSRSKSRSQSLQPPPEPVFTVQAFRSTSEQLRIPPVSAEASRRLEERVDAFPVACFPNTENGNPTLRRTTSKETLGTIFSVGSAEWREELSYWRLQGVLPPVPTHESIPENPKHKPEFRRKSYQAPLPPAPPRKPVKTRQSLPPAPRTHNPALQVKMQENFETQITSFDSISQSLGKSAYGVAASDSKRQQQERAKSITAEFEANAAARFARARMVSQESQQGSILHRTTSYDSIANQNPYGGESAGNSRVSSRRLPPSAHWNSGNSLIATRNSNPNLRDDEKTHSFVSIARVKSPPPVSMQTQRKMVPTDIGSHAAQQYSAPPPNRAPPQPPADWSAPPTTQDPWAMQRDFWATRKAEAVQSRKTLERKPVSARPSFDHPMPRSESARPSIDYQRPQILQSQTLSHHMSFDNSYHFQGQQWTSYEGEKAYDHTYGSYEYNKENQQQYYSRPQPEEEYYDGPSDDFQDQRLPQSIHKATNSTSNMLILDRFAGGLGYGYEPGYGIGGSAGTRNVGKMAAASRKSVDVSMNYGLDFSDVPVFLQRVKVES